MHLDHPPASRLGPRLVIIVAGTIILLAVIAVLSRESSWFDPPLPPSRLASPDGRGSGATKRPTHVGSATCRHCHPTEVSDWAGSHHDRAYSGPTDAALVGDFAGESLTVGATTTTFTRIDGHPSVVIERDRESRTERVHALFGTEPLQQLLIETEPGRVQAFPIAATTESAEGGGRWILIHDEESLDPKNAFHWTGLLHNWNHMCAECHSTALEKNFDRETGQFETTFEEPDVACEACHGPASEHVSWAARGAEKTIDLKGDTGNVHRLPVTLKRESSSLWLRAAGAATAQRIVGSSGTVEPRLLAETELAVCGKCHSRRSALVDGVTPGASFHDTYALELLTENLYFSDGQIRDEVFVLGSFLQSPMHAAGVTCSDCHDAHSGELHVEGNGLCLSCHAPEVFDTQTHHHHAEGSAGAECVECHMPARTYMKVDPRRDHSFRVPRPDLSLSIGSPDPCLGCHADQNSTWSSAQVAEWFPEGRSGTHHFGLDFDAIRAGASGATSRRDRLVSDRTLPAIVRATALTESVPVPPDSLPLILASLEDPSPLVRRAAVTACGGVPTELWIERALALTADPVKSVRLEATRAALLAGAAAPGSRHRDRLRAPIEELRTTTEIHGDRPESAVTLALVAASLGNWGEAETHYRRALEIEPTFGAAAVNLADLYRELGRDPEGAEVLEETIARSPSDSGLHYALALNQVRRRDLPAAEASLRTAIDLAPEDPRAAITLGILLAETERTKEARALLDRAIERHPRHAELRELRRSLGI